MESCSKPHTVPVGPMFSSARNNRCAAFFSPKIELPGREGRAAPFSPSLPPSLTPRPAREESLSEARLESFPPSLGRYRGSLNAGGIRGGSGGGGKGDSKNGVADPRRAVTPGPISRGHFSPEGERRQQPKITPLGPPSRAAADQSPGHGLIESRQSPLVGLIAPHHFRTSERSTSLLRDFYPDALARRAAPCRVTY